MRCSQYVVKLLNLIKMGHSRPLFLYVHLFNTVDSKQMFTINFADDWTRTVDLWYCKLLLYQLGHNLNQSQ